MKIESERLLKELTARRVAEDVKSVIFRSKSHAAARDAYDTAIGILKDLVEEESNRAENQANYKIDVDLFDEAEMYPNCTVQVLHNTITDEYSVGWWQN